MKKPYLVRRRGVLFQEDCLVILSAMRSETIDCVFADPPFNIDKDYKNGFSDKRAFSEYFAWCSNWISEACRVLKPGGAFFVYATPELAIRFGNLMNDKLLFRHWIALSMKGTYRRGYKLYPAHYCLLYYTKGIPKTFNQIRLPLPRCRHCGKELKDYGGHRDKLNPSGLNLTDFWDDTSPNRHPKHKVRPGVNELKITIPERAILISTKKGDVILDFFGGGGVTFQAAEINERNWVGVELHDCDHIATRLTTLLPNSVANEPIFNYKGIFEG